MEQELVVVEALKASWRLRRHILTSVWELALDQRAFGPPLLDWFACDDDMIRSFRVSIDDKVWWTKGPGLDHVSYN